jgi:predicted acyltransferase (DUF342 family)
MNELAIYLACAAGIALPTIPGLIQLRASKGQTTRIDQQYTRDPRYLGKAFRRTVQPMLTRCQPGERVAFLHRKEEFARVEQSVQLRSDAVADDVLLSRGDVEIGGHASLLDVFAVGHVEIGPDSQVRSLAADKGAALGDRTIVTRWIDVEGDLRVGRYCDLGSSASATGTIAIDAGTHFRRLFATRISVNGSSVPQSSTTQQGSTGRKRVVSEGSIIDGDLIDHRDVIVEDGAAIAGSIKCDGSVRLGTNARVQGSIIARGDVTIGEHATVLGHVFSERTVALASGASVGSADDLKTVQASDGMQLSGGVTIYGWAICERGGSTVALGA